MSLKPTARYARIYDIPIDFLNGEAISLVFADLDNTLAFWHTENVPEEAFKWVETVKQNGTEVCLLTNGRGQNADNIGKKLGITVYKNAKKPFPSEAKRIILSKGIKPENTLFVGDQLFTDIQLACSLNSKSVLTNPLSPREWWCTKVFNRTRERLVWRFVFNEPYPKIK